MRQVEDARYAKQEQIRAEMQAEIESKVKELKTGEFSPVPILKVRNSLLRAYK
jgi:hypothetical protein